LVKRDDQLAGYTEAEIKGERARPMRLCAGPRAKSRTARGSGDGAIGFLSTAEIGGRGDARQPVEPKTFLFWI
jgi:hypothetical protein